MIGALAEATVLVDGLDHPEGVTVGPDGAVWAGGEAGQVYRIEGDPAVATEIGTSNGMTLGLAADADGNVFTTDPKRRCVQVFRPDGSCRVYGVGEPPIRAPNHLCFDSAGNLYVSDSGRWKEHDGCLYRFLPGGRGEVWCDELRTLPNGVCIGPGEEHLYVAMSLAPGRIARVEIRADGSAGRAEDFVILEGTLPDGLAFDRDGNLYVVTYRPETVWVIPAGTRRAEPYAHDPEGNILASPTNLAFEHGDGGRLLVANIGRWHVTALPTPAPGLRLPYPANVLDP
ncbi:MAG: SMP-30/gluconolactonase/LRE family protein [Gaiellales bacterium]